MAHLTADWNVDVKVLGIEGLTARLAKGGKAARTAILRVTADSAARLEARTIDLCPKRSFYMSEHVRTDFSKGGFTYETGWDASDFLGTTDENGNPRAFYPFYVELGTKHMAADPSLSIAFAEEEPRYKAELKDAVRRALEE